MDHVPLSQGETQSEEMAMGSLLRCVWNITGVGGVWGDFLEEVISEQHLKGVARCGGGWVEGTQAEVWKVNSGEQSRLSVR